MRRSVTRTGVRCWSSVALAALMLSVPGACAWAADTVFDWGDNDKTVDSGKAHIKFTGPSHAGDIIVSFGDRKLYYITAPGEADTYPIAIPRDQSRWEGVTTVSEKRENPSWTPTAHMMAENPRLPRWVPGGHPMNPLGIRAMYLGSSDYRIHGTDAPWTIGTAASKGCVRMFNKDVVDLYPRVRIGSKVTVTWQKFDSKTLAMAEHAKAVSDPDPDHGQGGKVFAASYAADDAAEGLRASKAKGHKAAVTESEPVVEGNDDKAAEATTSARIVEPEARTAAPSSEPDAEATAKPVAQAETDKGDHRPRRSAKRAGHVDTSSLQSSDMKDEASALIVAKRAVVAAEKAAQAAERAAAAAERAAAASQDHSAPAASAAPSSVPSSGLVRAY